MGDGEGGGTGGRWGSALRPTKTEETVSHHQSSNVMEAGTTPVCSNFSTSVIAVSTAVGSKVTKIASEK